LKSSEGTVREESPPKVVLVDADDNPLGVEEPLACHLPPGRRHRAFTAVLLDHEGRIQLARRSPGKMLWHGCWDATVASHPRPGEEYVEAGERRVYEEIGVRCALHLLGRFEYRADFGVVGTEDEVCAALIGRLATGATPRPNPTDVDGLRAVTPDELILDLKNRPEEFCPWAFLALLCAAEMPARLPYHLADDFFPWSQPAARGALRVGLSAHFSNGGWRFLTRDTLR